MQKKIRYIDLFAGLGGIRIGLEQALSACGLEGECVFTSEIKPHAISVYQKNFPNEQMHGDITKVAVDNIPDFDVLLAGFPCQPFSSAGSRRGFLDTRGTLFFNIEEILMQKKPKAFLLENVEGLVSHDKTDKNKPIGRTLETILSHLQDLGYKVSWQLLDASEYGVPQKRKRIYIAGSLNNAIDLSNFAKTPSKLSDVLESITDDSLRINKPITQKLLQKYELKDLVGKQIKDKRGGKNNIHSWDIELKGAVSDEQKDILEALLRHRRRKDWAELKQIKWSDGMPLTLQDIASFHLGAIYNSDGNLQHLKDILDDLVVKKYLAYETPKQAPNREDLRGYNIVAGKLSFDISNILDPDCLTPTLVAMDVTKMAVIDKKGFRRLSTREGLRLFGFPESYDISPVSYTDAFDLLGNSVSINAIKLVSERVIEACFLNETKHNLPELLDAIPDLLQFATDNSLVSA
ncbi:MAG: DNA (cytosine-5-)-methyltransferase [Bifidobacteriaceae bacterium]|jgi:DNA (cytosine-5)-methyltransferase 1|nr:DNA (cytosine-5-)-methyltransferase [Bifidobacteriaceae bacterium]